MLQPSKKSYYSGVARCLLSGLVEAIEQARSQAPCLFGITFIVRRRKDGLISTAPPLYDDEHSLARSALGMSS